MNLTERELSEFTSRSRMVVRDGACLTVCVAHRVACGPGREQGAGVFGPPAPPGPAPRPGRVSPVLPGDRLHRLSRPPLPVGNRGGGDGGGSGSAVPEIRRGEVEASEVSTPNEKLKELQQAV